MKISSQFKDYYDFVAHAYGGGDPSVLYLRNRLVPRKQLDCLSLEETIEVKQAGLPRLLFTNRDMSFSVKWLAVAGRLYIILRPNALEQAADGSNNAWHVLTKELHPKVWECFFERKVQLWMRRFRPDPKDIVGVENKAVIELSRKINAPVFTFSVTQACDGAIVDGDIPVLSSLGIPAMIPAEQMYQNIAYFVGNTIHASPDMMPATTMANKDKIVSHGFDLKQSFRHRT